MDYHDGAPLRHVGDVTAMAAERYGEKLAFEYRGDELTYEGLESRANAVANVLTEHGVGPGDRVGVYLENNLQYPETFFGAIKAGTVPVPLNHRMDTGRLTYILEDADVTAIVGSLLFADTVRTLAAEAAVETVLLPDAEEDAGEIDYETAIAGAATTFDRPERDSEDIALQPYTSGTTGDPKGVLLTHENLLSSTQALSRLGSIDPERDTMLVVIPLFHIYGLSAVMLSYVTGGGTVILRTIPDAETMLEAITERGVTSFSGIPALYIEMVNELERNPDAYDLSTIESLGSAAAPLADDTRRRIEDVFGVPLTEGWGMTETAPAGAIDSARGVQKGAGCIGQPVPDTEVKLVDPETRETRVPPAHLDPTAPAELTGSEPDFDEESTQTGEIAIRGPQVFEGYHNLPAKTEAVFDEEGWFYTDDIARVDEDRFLWMVDRADDMIIVGGENVYPAEVEDALFEHPAVEEAAVVAAPHEVKGEAPVAYAVLGEGYEAGADVTERELRTFTLEYVATFAHPRRVTFVDQLPRSGTQKVQRFKLEERARTELGELEPSERL